MIRKTLLACCLLLAGFTAAHVKLEVPDKLAEAPGKRPAPQMVNLIRVVHDASVLKEAKAIHQQGQKATWLVPYDVLTEGDCQESLRDELEHGCDVGGWWEISELHVKDARGTWKGRSARDAHADKGLSVGYTPQERLRLVDTYMEAFQEVFGAYPKSMGAAYIDAVTLTYMQERYGVEACCIQGEESAVLWGGYTQGAYYPSRKNALMPAQTLEEQIDLPVVRIPGTGLKPEKGEMRVVETLLETCRRFRAQHLTTPVSAAILEDGALFNSRFYRAQLLWQGDSLAFGDIHLFDERVASPYLNEVCISSQMSSQTLPLMDSRAENGKASLCLTDAEGNVLRGRAPIVTRNNRELLIRWPLKEKKGEIQVSLTEESMRITCTDKSLRWALRMRGNRSVQLPVRRTTLRSLLCELDGWQYRVDVLRGACLPGKMPVLESRGGMLELSFSNRSYPAAAAVTGYPIVENGQQADTENWFLQTRHKYNNWPDRKVEVAEPLTLAVFSDLHGDGENLERYLQFCRHYAPYIDGKYVIGDIIPNQFSDDFSFFSSTPGAEYIHLVMGNHDTNDGKGNWCKFAGKPAFDKYFSFSREGWQADGNVHQPSDAAAVGKCWYYVDYLQQGIRVVALDCMAYSETQLQWFREVLRDSREKGLAVVAMHHIPLGDIEPEGVLNSCDYPVYNEPYCGEPHQYLLAVDDFIEQGGRFLTWISGHSHYDGCGPLKEHPRQMTLTFENAHANDYWNDDTRKRGTKSQDSFNLLTFDLHSNCVKILRVGNDMDRMSHRKTTAVYGFK